MIGKTVLENGIRVITEKMQGVRSVALGIVLDAGPGDERPAQYGLAHLTEHMMFQGTSSRDASQIARLMHAAGDQMGAFTTRDYTCYYGTVLDEYFPYALDLLGDALLNSIFPAGALETEKEAILNEIRAERDTPDHRVHSLLKALAWPTHSLGRAITGRPETVMALSREDIIYFTQEHYAASRMIIAAAGNIAHEDFVAQVRDAFWRLTGKSEPAPAVPALHTAGVRVEHMPVSQAYFSLGLPAYSYTHANRYGLHLLNNILGGGISSRFYRHIREERGLVYHIDSQYHAYREAGLLVIEGSTLPEYLMQVLGTVLFELYQLMTGEKAIDADELWKAKMHLRGQHLLSSENSNTRMSRLATQELYFGRHIAAAEILEQIDAVDSVTLQRVADELLTDFIAHLTVAVVGPSAPEYYSQHAIEELLAGLR